MLGSTAIGIDISDRTLELVELVKRGRRFQISKAARVTLQPGVIERGVIKKDSELEAALKKLFVAAGLKPNLPPKVNVNLPESQTYLTALEIDPTLKKDINQVINEALESNTPFEAGEAWFKVSQIRKKESKQKLWLVTVGKATIKTWLAFFGKLRIEVTFYSDGLAIYKGLGLSSNELPYAIVDLGSVVTSMFFYDIEGLAHTYQVNCGGENLTLALVEKLGLPFEKAEQVKKEQGMAGGAQTEIAYSKALKQITDQLEANVTYFKTAQRQELHRLILVGESSKLIGLAAYLQDKSGISTTLGKSFIAKESVGPEFVGAIGLSLCALTQDKMVTLPSLTTQDLPLLESYTRSHAMDSSSFAGVGASPRKFPVKIAVAIIALIGLLIPGSYYSYRLYNQPAQTPTNLVTVPDEAAVLKTLTLKLPVAVTDSENALDRIKGRLSEVTIEKGKSYEEIYAYAQTASKATLTNDEQQFAKPIKVSDALDNQLDLTSEVKLANFPWQFYFLAYSEANLREILVLEITKLKQGSAEVILGEVKVVNAEFSVNPAVYFLEVEANLKLTEVTEFKQQEMPQVLEAAPTAQVTTSEESIASGSGTIQITDTETGSLNVRSGPGLEFSIVASVAPGEQFMLLKKDDQWWQIKLDGTENGWILAEYARLIEVE